MAEVHGQNPDRWPPSPERLVVARLIVAGFGDCPPPRPWPNRPTKTDHPGGRGGLTFLGATGRQLNFFATLSMGGQGYETSGDGGVGADPNAERRYLRAAEGRRFFAPPRSPDGDIFRWISPPIELIL